MTTDPMTSGASTTASGTTMSLSAIKVADLERSIRFYVDGCGFIYEREFATTTFDAAILRAGTSGLELIVPRTGGSVVHGDSFVKFVVNTPDVAGLMDGAVASGGTIEQPATVLTNFGGVTMGMLRDPDGYLVEIVERRPRS